MPSVLTIAVMMKKLIQAFRKSKLNPSLWVAGGVYLAQSTSTGGGILNDFFTKDIKNAFGNIGTGAPAGAQSVGDLIISIVSVLLLVAGSIAVVFLMIGGYQYVTAHGNEEASEAAKKTITSSIVGLAVVTLAFAIVRIISALLLQGNTGIG